jgi:ribosomal-protein-alanine N-acetyltransferase
MFYLQNTDFRKILIETESLILKEIPFDYKNRFYELFSDLEVLRFTDKQPTHTIDEAIVYLKECHNKSAQKEHIYLGIFDKSDQKLLGIVSLYHIDSKHQFGSLGILLDKKRWRKGIMSGALYAFLQFCFNTLQFHRIEAQTYVNNIPAVKFFEKLHFTNEGRLRQNFLIEGKYQDSHLFSILRSEFGSDKEKSDED